MPVQVVPSPSPSGEINTLLGRGTSFEGKLTFEGTVRIDGRLVGEIFSDDVLVIGLNRAMDLLAKKLAGTRLLGAHPKDAEPVEIKRGRFGPYARHGKLIANLPRGVMADDMTLDQAVALLAEKGKPLAPRGARKGAVTHPGARAELHVYMDQ